MFQHIGDANKENDLHINEINPLIGDITKYYHR